MSVWGYFRKVALRKKLRRKKRLEQMRRTHIIIEARKAHERNRKKAKESLAMGGYTEVKTIEQEDLGKALAYGVNNRIEKLKMRQRKLGKSKQTHMNRLKKARKKMQARQRT